MLLTLNERELFVACHAPRDDICKQDLLMIHGAGHDHRIWHDVAAALTRLGYRVFVPDLPGHGQSTGPVIRGIEQLADWTLALSDHLELNPVLIGHSMGSLIALHAAALQPERLSALVLMGSVAPMPVAPALLQAAEHDRTQAYALINRWSFASAGDDLAASARLESLAQHNLDLMNAQPDGVLAADLHSCNDYCAGLEVAQKITTPTLMLCGARDKMTPVKAAAALHDALAQKVQPSMVTLAGVGHTMMREDPRAVVAALDDFLGQLTPSRTLRT